MSNKYKNLEGSVSVNGDITPITRQPINQIDSERWSEMSPAELADQRMYLIERINLLKSLGQMTIATQLERGLIALDSIMAEKNVGVFTGIM